MTDRLTSEQIDKSCDSITGMLNLMCSRAGYTLDANTQMDISLLRAQAKLAAPSPPVAALPEEPIVVVNRGDSYAVIAGYSKNVIATFQKHCGEMAESYAVGYDSGRESVRAAASGLAFQLEHEKTLRTIAEVNEDVEKQRASSLSSENQRLRERVAELEELHRMQQAAICVAAYANTHTSMKEQSIDKDNPYWTPGYGDVITAIKREIRERERAEASEHNFAIEHDLRSAAEAAAQSAVARAGELERDAERWRVVDSVAERGEVTLRLCDETFHCESSAELYGAVAALKA